MNRRIEAHHLAAKTFATHNAILIASRGELLAPEEAERALSLPVTPANVFGEPPLAADELVGERAAKAFFEPSVGFNPSFGERRFTVEDGDNRLYVLKLEGDVSAFLGRQRFEVGRRIVVKVGHAKEPKERCDTHNAHLPPACQFRWKVAWLSPPFPGGQEAKAAEDTLKASLARVFESLGREFFLGDEPGIEAEFSKASRSVSFVISMTG